jgi:hypothetical protein
MAAEVGVRKPACIPIEMSGSIIGKLYKTTDDCHKLIRCVAFAKALETSLNTTKPNLLSDADKDLYNNIERLCIKQHVDANHVRDWDDHGTRLWNAAMRLRKSGLASQQLICLSEPRVASLPICRLINVSS